MTLHREEVQVGVRDLHDRLSEHLESVEQGADIVVTRRGKRIARISAVDAPDPLADLAARGLIRLAEKPRQPRQATIEAQGSVSELIGQQRR